MNGVRIPMLLLVIAMLIALMGCGEEGVGDPEPGASINLPS